MAYQDDEPFLLRERSDNEIATMMRDSKLVQMATLTTTPRVSLGNVDGLRLKSSG
jgi:hypothetical protein